MVLPTLADPHDEPTRPAASLPARALVALARIARHAELARERLTVAPDDDALVAALENLDAISALASEVAS